MRLLKMRILSERKRRISLPRPLFSALRGALSATSGMPTGDVLQENCLRLSELIFRLRDALRAQPPLPAGEYGTARIMALAAGLADQGDVSADALLLALRSQSEWDFTTAERIALPMAAASACSEKLYRVLKALRTDAHSRVQGQLAARRLPRMKRPGDLLNRYGMSGVFLGALREALADSDDAVSLEVLDAWLLEQGSSAAELARRCAAHEARQTDALRSGMTDIEALLRLDWLPQCLNDAPLHQLFLQDPAGVYPRMTAASCTEMCIAAENLARRFHVGPFRLAEEVLACCRDAADQGPERHVGYWLLDPEGVSALQKRLQTRHGLLSCLVARHRQEFLRAGLWGYSAVVGFSFLQGRQPLLLLPFFLIAAGTVSRALAARIRRPTWPEMTVHAVTEDLRTLVVLPAVLHDVHEAIACARYLKTARHAFPAYGADFLLLGDHAPCSAPHAPQDAAVCTAAAAAVSALNEEGQGRFLYLHRGRVPDEDLHVCAGRDGRLGAVRALCRLIAQGECEDVLEYASDSPAFFHRHYAFVLTLTPAVRPIPGMLETLLAAASHPLCTRFPTPDGWRGHAVLTPRTVDDPTRPDSRFRSVAPQTASAAFDGVGLIRPDAYLEATDGVLPASFRGTDALAGELAGTRRVGRASALRSRPGSLSGRQDRAYRRTLLAWRSFLWLFPFVSTPSGFLRTPLNARSRFRLREAMRAELVAPACLLLLLYALLTGNIPLAAIVLAAPEVPGLSPPWRENFLRALYRIAFLPLRSAVRGLAIFDALRDLLPRVAPKTDDTPPGWTTLEVWAQGVAATICMALAIAVPGNWWFALALAGLFGCFPLLHRWLDEPVSVSAPPDENAAALLTDVSAKTWQYFLTCVTPETQDLPPVCIQYDPQADLPAETGPAAIAGWMLACLSARELGLIPAREAADRLAHTLAGLRQLPMPDMLPCRRYSLPSLTISDPTADSAECGLLLCALLACAQAVRTWLPECRPDQYGLPAALDEFAAALDVRRLYDDEAGLFHAALDADGHGTGPFPFASDLRLLLSVSAAAMRTVPPEHMTRLSASFVQADGTLLPLTMHGDAAACLAPGLFLPADPTVSSAVVRMQQLRGMEGLFGLSGCAVWDFAPDLRCRRITLGLSEIAAQAPPLYPAYSAYAAALCLPAAPHAAAHSLMAMRERGMLTDLGFCDSIDMSHRGPHGGPLPHLTGLYDTLHQGLILCAAAHVLRDAPIRRFFCALPQVEAMLPLVQLLGRPRHVLPAGIRPTSRQINRPSVFLREALPPSVIPDAQLLGDRHFSVLTDVNGSNRICAGEPVTRTRADESALTGLQLYLSDEGRVFRVTDAALSGTTVFSGASAEYERLCGSLRTRLTILADPLRKRALHLLEITNLSTRERIVEAADCLLPEAAVPPDTLQAERPSPDHLVLLNRRNGRTLHHRILTAEPPVLLTACTDESAFLGRGRTLHAPASLDEPMADLLQVSSSPCLSFRVQLSLGGRGQTSLLFATGLTDDPLPALAGLRDLQALAGLQSAAAARAVPLTPVQEHAASLMTGLLLQDGRKTAAAVELTSLDGLPLLADVLAAASWFSLKGADVSVCAVCTDELREAVQETIQASILPQERTAVMPVCPDGVRIVLREGAGTLIDQLTTLYIPCPVPLSDPPVIPAALPKVTLRHAGGCGGFDQETNDFLVGLEPRQTTPAPWKNTHLSPLWRETADESGLHAPFDEFIRIRQEETVTDPFSVQLPRIMRQGAGYTEWQCWTDVLDITLTACCMPGLPAGLRVLRITNASDSPLSLTVQAASPLLSSGVPALLPGAALAPRPDGRHTACLAGLSEGWTSASCLLRPDMSGTAHILPREDGRTALIACTLSIPAGGTEEAVWICGRPVHLEQLEQASAMLRESGASALLMQVRREWTPRLSALSLSSPEDTLDLLLDRLLPLQLRTAKEPSPEIVPALAVTDPDAARAALLACAERTSRRSGWFLLALAAEQYIRITEDREVLHARLPSGTLSDRCADAVMTLPLDHRNIPTGTAPAKRAFMAAAAADALHRLTGAEGLRDMSRMLRNAADTYLWENDHYGEEDVRLDDQTWAVLAEGENRRTQQAISAAWTALYDEEHGLLRQRTPDERHAPLPGTPCNGGQDTLSAVRALQALLRAGQTEHAWTLLRALNPIHHTDDPLRTETFRAAPWLLPAGLDASPAQAGRASGRGDAAAGALYLTLLEDMLGFRRRGSKVHLAPCVPREWDGFTLTLQYGASTWHFSMERSLDSLYTDGAALEGSCVALTDDGRVHQVRYPL